jgi:hypothetical protein
MFAIRLKMFAVTYNNQSRITEIEERKESKEKEKETNKK